MSTSINRQRTVFYALALVTILLTLALWLGFGGPHSSRHINAFIAVVAFVKARYVVLDFMELRNSRLMNAFDLWLLVTCVLCVGLILK